MGNGCPGNRLCLWLSHWHAGGAKLFWILGISTLLIIDNQARIAIPFTQHIRSTEFPAEGRTAS